MIYIVGHTFTAGASNTTASMKSGSLQQQLTESKLGNARVSRTEFTPGCTYKLVHIKPILDVKKIPEGLEYHFIDTKTNQAINKIFKTTYEADNFIASISGLNDELKKARDEAYKAQTTGNN